MVRVKDSSWWNNRGQNSNIKHNYLNSSSSSNTVPHMHSTSPALTSTPLSPMPTY